MGQQLIMFVTLSQQIHTNSRGNKCRSANKTVPINTKLSYARKSHTPTYIHTYILSSSQTPLKNFIIISISMAVFTYENDTTSTVPPAKLFKAVVHDADIILPKVIDSIKTVEILEGNGGPGTVKKITFVEGGQTLYVLHKVEAIDDAKFEYNYSLVGGVGISDIVEKISFEAKLVEGPDGGSVGKMTVKYHTKGDAKPIEKEVEEGKAKRDALFKAIEGYVLANPNYN